MNCCTYECNQGRNCPIRAQLAAKGCATPLRTDNSDGTSNGDTTSTQGAGLSTVRAFLLIYSITALIAYCLL